MVLVLEGVEDCIILIVGKSLCAGNND